MAAYLWTGPREGDSTRPTNCGDGFPDAGLEPCPRTPDEARGPALGRMKISRTIATRNILVDARYMSWNSSYQTDRLVFHALNPKEYRTQSISITWIIPQIAAAQHSGDLRLIVLK